MLGIKARFGLPYNPNAKARLERWFRTLGDFCKTFHTYTGESVETKPERLNEILATPRLIPSFEEVHQRLTNHIAGYNASAEHSKADLSEDGQPLSPNEAMSRWCDTRRVHDPAALDLLLAMWHKPVPVGRNGITIAIRGRSISYGAFAAELMPFKALSKDKRRCVNVAYDPHDIRTVRVHDEQFRFVCVAEMNRLGGLHGTDPISIATVADLNREKAAYDKALRAVNGRGLVGVLTPEEQLAELAARKPASPPASSPAALKIIQTPLDGVEKDIRRDELKRAVGAEQQPAARRPSVFDKLHQVTPPRVETPRDDSFTDPWAKATQQRLLREAQNA
jgi:hypothetical protein